MDGIGDKLGCKCDKVCFDQVMLQKNLEVDDETGYKEAFKVRKMIMFLTKMIKKSDWFEKAYKVTTLSIEQILYKSDNN